MERHNTAPRLSSFATYHDIFGTENDDILQGGPDSNWIYGLGGNDQLYGGCEADILEGHEGDDLLDGKDGDDRLIGGSGDDRLIGGNGKDMLLGGEGNDRLCGGAGNDLLNGGHGNDFLEGGLGRDDLNGGAGNDVFYWHRDRLGGGGDRVRDFVLGEDVLKFDGVNSERVKLFTVPGNANAVDIIILNEQLNGVSQSIHVEGANLQLAGESEAEALRRLIEQNAIQF